MQIEKILFKGTTGAFPATRCLSDIKTKEAGSILLTVVTFADFLPHSLSLSSTLQRQANKGVLIPLTLYMLLMKPMAVSIKEIIAVQHKGVISTFLLH